MQELIENLIQSYDLPTRDCVSGENKFQDIVDAFIEFGKQVCELQKQECTNNALNLGSIWEDDKQSILNAKNICDE